MTGGGARDNVRCRDIYSNNVNGGACKRRWIRKSRAGMDFEASQGSQMDPNPEQTDIEIRHLARWDSNELSVPLLPRAPFQVQMVPCHQVSESLAVWGTVLVPTDRHRLPCKQRWRASMDTRRVRQKKAVVRRLRPRPRFQAGRDGQLEDV